MFDGPASQSGKPSFGVQESNAGKVVIFGAGIPVIIGGNIVGAVEASAETVEQDISVVDAAVAALPHPAQPPCDHQGLRFAGRLWMVLSRRDN